MKNNNYLFIILFIMLVTTVLAVGCACDDDDDNDDNNDASNDDDDNDTGNDDDDDDDTGDDDDDDDAWWPPTPGLTMIYSTTEWTLLTFDFPATVIGDDSYQGGVYTKFEFGDLEAVDAIGVEAWFDMTTVDELGFKGANMYWTDEKKAGEPDGSFVMDDPIVVYFSDVVDNPQSSEADGEWSDPDYGAVPVTMEIVSTTTDLDTVVTVPYGTVEHCRAVDIVISEDFAHTYVDRTVSATLYVHRDLGLVKMEGDFIFGFLLELKEIVTN